MLATLKHPGRVLAMVVATLVNLVPITVPGGVLVALGSFVVLPLVLTLAPPWAILAAAVPAAATVWTVGIPSCWFWSLLWKQGDGALGAEGGPVLQDLLYWLMVGVPLTFYMGRDLRTPRRIFWGSSRSRMSSCSRSWWRWRFSS